MDAISHIVGERITGKLEYMFRPKLRDPWGSGFNGQAYRQRIFDELVKVLNTDALIETGTCRGSTTEYLLKKMLPVFTTEASPRFHAFAELRLKGQKNLHMYRMDSRDFIRTLLSNEQLQSFKRPFFYLDAHWYEDLPLREEIDLIFSNLDDAVILVDDFEVPGTKYGFDDYGDEKALTLKYLDSVEELEFSTFFPAEDENSETGAKRGCVVLSNNPATKSLIEGIALLKPGPEFPRTR